MKDIMIVHGSKHAQEGEIKVNFHCSYSAKLKVNPDGTGNVTVISDEDGQTYNLILCKEWVAEVKGSGAVVSGFADNDNNVRVYYIHTIKF